MLSQNRKLTAISSVALTSNGGATGIIEIADSSVFTYGQKVILSSSAVENKFYYVYEILNDTSIRLVEEDGKTCPNLTNYLLTDSASISANAQELPVYPEQEVERSTYQDGPAFARRSLLVDQSGNPIGEDNPLTVSFDATTTECIPEAKIGLDTNRLNVLVPMPWDEIDIVSKNAFGEPTLVDYKKAGTTVATVTLTYDGDGDLRSVVRS